MTGTADQSGLWLTDFDGTIKPLDHRAKVSPEDLSALKRLKAEGWVRAVVTGRSLFSFALAWEPGLELDWLIFSSGAGLCSWSPMGPGPLLDSRAFRPPEAESALTAALNLDFGFFAYLAPPDSHHFYYLAPPAPAPEGFRRRLKTFAPQGRPFPADFLDRPPARRPILSQVLLMIPAPQAARAGAELDRARLSWLSSASPFDDGCRWLEILPPGVSKGRAAAALAERLGLDRSRTAATGNDYNDQDLLDWVGRAFVTRDAPPDLLARHRPIAPAGQGGLAEAVALALAEI
ncbi:MAG: HAD hydrolase family protein [Deltaproteobacteria bacterium]|nr:HAD hydrolase family protein [Deltaproteobacteria bacterium]